MEKQIDFDANRAAAPAGDMGGARPPAAGALLRGRTHTYPHIQIAGVCLRHIVERIGSDRITRATSWCCSRHTLRDVRGGTRTLESDQLLVGGQSDQEQSAT
jgi:hypothetical protein